MVVEICQCNYSTCILMARVEVVEVLEVGNMDVSQALVDKYYTTNKVQEISLGSLNIGA